MLTFNCFSRRVEITFGFFFVIAVTALSGLSGIWPLAFCVFHELSHLFAMHICGVKALSIRFYGAGIKIDSCGISSLKKSAQALIYLSGPASNFLAAVVLKGYLRQINIVLFVFNMLPISYFDGGRLISVVLGENSIVLKILSFAATILLAALLGYAALAAPLNISASSLMTVCFIVLSSLLDNE